MVYIAGFSVQVLTMNGWQLRWAMCWRRVERVEVVALRCCGYAVRLALRDGSLRELTHSSGRTLWPSLPALKRWLRGCGVRQVVLLQPEYHDEIIARPVMVQADPGLLLRLD
jgi:hypothetical protein